MKVGLVLVIAVCAAAAQAQMKIPAASLTKAPVIDGVLTEGEWKEAAHLTDFLNPFTGKPAEDGTEVWLAYDAECIYVAFFMHEADTSKIITQGTQPDAISGDDQITVNIDPFNKRFYNSFNSFTCNPNGVHTETLSGGRSAKREWRGLWQSVAKITDKGWVAEMRIPWKIMTLPGAGKHDAAIYFERVQKRTSSTSMLPNMSQQFWYDRAATWTGVSIPNVREKNLFFQGYMSGESVDGRGDAQFGGDVRYRISPKLTALATFNPDFTNVEQSVAGIEYSHSERYLDDSRPFFNEGDSYFQLNDSWGSLFYTRRVGDFDYGGKFYGNLDSSTEVGLMAAQTGGDETDIVYRYCHLWAPRKSVTIFGSTLYSPEVTDHTAGTRLVYGAGNLSLIASGALNDNDGSKYAANALFGYFTGPWSLSASYLYVEPDFNPALGYISFNDRRGLEVYTSYDDRKPQGYIRALSGYFQACSYDHFDGSSQLRQVSGYLGIQTKNKYGMSLSFDSAKYDTTYEKVMSYSLSSSNRTNTFGVWVSGNYGERGGETTSYLSGGGSCRIGKKLTLNLSYSQQTYFNTARQTVFTASQIIDAKRTVSGRVVWQDNHTNAYLAFKSAGFTGMDWYLIVGDPNSLEWKDRIVAKLVWAW